MQFWTVNLTFSRVQFCTHTTTANTRREVTKQPTHCGSTGRALVGNNSSGQSKQSSRECLKAGRLSQKNRHSETHTHTHTHPIDVRRTGNMKRAKQMSSGREWRVEEGVQERAWLGHARTHAPTQQQHHGPWPPITPDPVTTACTPKHNAPTGRDNPYNACTAPSCPVFQTHKGSQTTTVPKTTATRGPRACTWLCLRKRGWEAGGAAAAGHGQQPSVGLPLQPINHAPATRSPEAQP